MKTQISSWQAWTVAAFLLLAPVAGQADTNSNPSESILQSAASSPTAFPWSLDLNKARQEAYDKDKLLLIYYFSQESPECHRLEDKAFKDKRVLLLVEEFVPVPIDGEEGPGSETMSRYGEKKFPLIPVVKIANDEEGDVKEKVVANLDSPESDTAGIYATKLAELLEKYSLPRMTKAAQQGDLTAMARLATVYTSLKKTNEAEFILDEASRMVAKKPNKHDSLAVADIALADLYISTSDYTGAILMLEHALSVAEKSRLVEAQIKLGYALYKKGSKTEARKHLQAAKDSPDASEAAKNLASQYLTKASR